MPIATHMESFSNIKLNSLEGNTDLFITGYNSLLANDDTKVVRDFYLLLMVYVNYFCIPVISFAIKGLCGFGKGIQNKFSEKVNFVCMAVTFLAEDKEYISTLGFVKERAGRIQFFFKKLKSKNRVALAQLWQHGFLMDFVNGRMMKRLGSAHAKCSSHNSLYPTKSLASGLVVWVCFKYLEKR